LQLSPTYSSTHLLVPSTLLDNRTVAASIQRFLAQCQAQTHLTADLLAALARVAVIAGSVSLRLAALVDEIFEHSQLSLGEDEVVGGFAL
jgi:hypothetical protein